MNELSEQARALAAAGRADRPTAADRARLAQAVQKSIAAAPVVRLPFRLSSVTTVATVAAAVGGALWVALRLLPASEPSAPAGSQPVRPAASAVELVAVPSDTALSAPSDEPAGPSIAEPSSELTLPTAAEPVRRSSRPTAMRDAAGRTEQAVHSPPPPSSGAAGALVDEPAPEPAAAVLVPRAPVAADEPPAPEPSAPASTLLDELRLLRAAQAALSAGRPSTALASLDEHRASYPTGLLREERDAARVLALCELGRTAEACELGRAFLASSPRSPQVGRVSASCVQRCAGATK